MAVTVGMAAVYGPAGQTPTSIMKSGVMFILNGQQQTPDASGVAWFYNVNMSGNVIIKVVPPVGGYAFKRWYYGNVLSDTVAMSNPATLVNYASTFYSKYGYTVDQLGQLPIFAAFEEAANGGSTINLDSILPLMILTMMLVVVAKMAGRNY